EIAITSTGIVDHWPYTLTAATSGTIPAGSSVAFYVDGQSITTSANPATSSDGTNWSQQWTSASAQAHSVVAEVFDANAKLVAMSQPFSASVGQVDAPGVPLQPPANNLPTPITLNPT